MVWMQAQTARNRKPSLNGKPSVLNCLEEKGKQREITVFRYCGPYGQTCSCQEPVRCVWRYTDGLPLWQPNLHQPVCLLSHLHWSSLPFIFLSHFSFPPFLLLLYLLRTIHTASHFSCLWPFFVYFLSAFLIISLNFRKTADVHFLSLSCWAQINNYHLGYVGSRFPYQDEAFSLPLNFSEIKYWFAWYNQFWFYTVLCLTDRWTWIVLNMN